MFIFCIAFDRMKSVWRSGSCRCALLTRILWNCWPTWHGKLAKSTALTGNRITASRPSRTVRWLLAVPTAINKTKTHFKQTHTDAHNEFCRPQQQQQQHQRHKFNPQRRRKRIKCLILLNWIIELTWHDIALPLSALVASISDGSDHQLRWIFYGKDIPALTQLTNCSSNSSNDLTRMQIGLYHRVVGLPATSPSNDLIEKNKSTTTTVKNNYKLNSFRFYSLWWWNSWLHWQLASRQHKS